MKNISCMIISVLFIIVFNDALNANEIQSLETVCNNTNIENMSFKKAVNYENNEKYNLALSAYCALAKLGDDRAQFRLARHLATGEHVQRNSSKALSFLVLSMSYYTSPRKEQLYDSLVTSGVLSAQEIEQSIKEYELHLSEYGTGMKFDGNAGLSAKQLERIRKKTEYTTVLGSKMKRKKEEEKLHPVKTLE